ncbi:oligopeptide ABC transporter permease [Haloimpatiens lingqiaonensis]|uniref:oligopeptide ABC transporter permease n=1 Tax=Haloimpatiens lingqiaonensis TaxID=1380675 RepID=UPI0024313A66|nr:oligopeptide ABC transporter permease [Haloimpatiens lingqiaonensis]
MKENEIVSPFKIVLRRLRKNKLAMLGMCILIFMILFSFIGPWFSSYNMNTMSLVDKYKPPTSTHILGTDEVGRDVLTRLMYGGRVSLLVGILAVIIEVVIGSILGAIAGYYGGKIDAIIMRIVDMFMCLPGLPILIMLAAVMSDLKIKPENRMYVIMFIIGFLGWPSLCRIVRGQILSLREQEFMQAAECLGLSDKRKMFVHLLPNTFASIIVSATLGIGGAILTESTLSFLGLGVTPPTPSWGQMVQKVNDLFTLKNRMWVWAPPGLCIFLTVMAINLFGDGLRDALDPKLKV